MAKKKQTYDRRIRLRLLSTVLCGVFLLNIVVYWRQQYLAAAEYIDFYPQVKKHSVARPEMQSKNYKLDTQDISPAVK